jgi:hypothetical protein
MVILVYGFIGAMTFSIITISITTFSIMDLTVTLCIITLGIMDLTVTLCIITLGIMTL